jgi:penicillin-binding protein 1A
MTRRSRLRRNRSKVHIIRIILVIVGIFIAANVIIVMGTIANAIKDLPDLEKSATQHVDQTSKIYDKNRKLITTFHAEQNRVIIPLKKIPKNVQSAIIAIEDRRFYQHHGVDLEAIVRAIETYIKSGSTKEGGSTLTQQYVKNTLLTHEKTFNRKIKEAFLAYDVEKKYNKKEILEKYMNTVYFGNGSYGVETAAESYFGKKADKLTLPESALIAGLIRSPISYSPYYHPENALKRRNRVIKEMYNQKYITKDQALKAMETKIKLKPQTKAHYGEAYFVEFVKSQILNDKRFGSTEQQRADALFRGGLKIYTTIDPKLQALAEQAVKKNLGSPNDPSASTVCIEPKTGYIKTMVGGRNFFSNSPNAKFNIAYQGRRQTGSAFKVFVLVTALLQGISPNKTYDTSPVTIPIKGSLPWHVNNFEGKGYGRMTIAEGTMKSVNALYARLMMDVGAKNVVATAHKLGITTAIKPNPAIALGGLSRGVSPFEMAVAIATLADDGIRHKPISVIKIVDSKGKLLLKNEPSGRRVIPAKVAATATSVLERVIQNGTGVAANIGRPSAGKTGTAQNHHDAWFIGYTPDLATSVWVGYPNTQQSMLNVHGIKVTGGSFPAKIWHDFMLPAHENIPSHDFTSSPYAFKKEPFKQKTDEGIKVPNVVGQTPGEAYAIINRAGFKPVKSYKESDKPSGTVIEQSPAGGSKAKKGSSVTVYISSGPAKVKIPNVTGMAEGSAESTLQSKGFSVSIRRETGTPEQKGIVISQSPGGGAKAKDGSTVTITVGN